MNKVISQQLGELNSGKLETLIEALRPKLDDVFKKSFPCFPTLELEFSIGGRDQVYMEITVNDAIVLEFHIWRRWEPNRIGILLDKRAKALKNFDKVEPLLKELFLPVIEALYTLASDRETRKKITMSINIT